MMNRIILIIMLFIVSFSSLFAKDYFVGGPGASDSNPGTPAQPFATIQKAASVAVAGDVIKIRSGTYRETITPVNSGTGGNPITFLPDQGAVVTISGLNVVDNAGWSVHNGNIYKKSITLPVNGYGTTLTTNTTILANQVFKGGEMQFEARWPKISSVDDLLDQKKLRQKASTSSFSNTQITDSGIPTNVNGGVIVVQGWFITQPKRITGHSGSTITFQALDSNPWYNKMYYVTNKLGLLTQAKEWHYESGTLYFWQAGGGSPTGVEFKARNWAFDLRSKSHVSIIGLRIIGCDPVMGNTGTSNIIIDNIRASYMNHAVFEHQRQHPGFGNALMMGSKLAGANNTVKNSELHHAASTVFWLGANGRVENNLIHDVGYEGNWGAPINLWDKDGGQVIKYNTIYRTGRSAIDFGWHNSGGRHLNVEIGYNHMHDFGMTNWDLGATYAHGATDLTGLDLHHNWIHDNHANAAPTANDVGLQTAIYFDQASGPGTVHHNVTWNAGHADVYHEVSNVARPGGAIINFYNNTFATVGYGSYITWISAPNDVQKNNIYISAVNISHGASKGNITNSIFSSVNPQFSGTGANGLLYCVKAGSPAINTGAVVSGITDGNIGTPDIGAYEYGGTNWIPGYTQVGQPTIPTTPTTVPVTTVSMSPGNVTMAIGATSQLSKTINPLNATNQNVVWTTSNASVATVNPSGLVTAVVAGSATITATTQDGSFKATSAITVNASAPSQSIVGIDNAMLGTSTNQHNYSGAGWAHGTSQPTFLNGTLSFSNVTNNSVTLSFVGNKLEWYTEKFNHHGIAAVSIDNGPETNVDLYAASGAQQLLVYTSPALIQGTHTFKIRVTGTKNPASTGYYAIHDFVKVYSGNIAATGIAVSPISSTMTMGAATTLQLTKTVSPSAATNQNVLWTTSNASVVTVSSAGLVSAVAAGSATITATTQDGSFKATSAITVNASAPSQSIVGIDDAILGTSTHQHNYSGAAWVHGTSLPTFLNGTLSYSNVANNSVTLSFVGNKLEWYTEKFKHHGIAAVSIDNGAEVNIDLYSATGAQQLLVYTSPALVQGTHTFKIRVTGTKNAASTGYYAIHDFVKVYSSVGGGGGGSRVATMEEESIDLQAYPNPISSGDILHIELPDAIGALKISDMMGKSKYASTVSETKLEVATSDWANGMYLLIYKSPGGMKTKKILIQ